MLPHPLTIVVPPDTTPVVSLSVQTFLKYIQNIKIKKYNAVDYTGHIPEKIKPFDFDGHMTFPVVKHWC